jgi:hypothetical protein
MAEQVLPWVGLGVLFLLCLPIPAVQKVVLEVTAWSLRLALIGLLAAGAYLWFRPGDMPADVSAVLADFPRLLSVLPAQGSPAFALCAACWVAAVFVPVLAMLDVTRKLAGERLCRLRELTSGPVKPVAVATPAKPATTAEPETLPDAVEVGVPVLRPVERRTAAAAIASAGSRNTR